MKYYKSKYQVLFTGDTKFKICKILIFTYFPFYHIVDITRPEKNQFELIKLDVNSNKIIDYMIKNRNLYLA